MTKKTIYESATYVVEESDSNLVGKRYHISDGTYSFSTAIPPDLNDIAIEETMRLYKMEREDHLRAIRNER